MICKEIGVLHEIRARDGLALAHWMLVSLAAKLVGLGVGTCFLRVCSVK